MGTFSPEYESCGRCSGEGTLGVRLGRPDPERDTHVAYTGPWCLYPTVDCPACLGSGWRKVRVERTFADGEFHVHSSRDLSQMSFDDIFDKMQLPTIEEGTNAVHQEK